jgi:plasmid maintenance system antidote protein VapI
MRTIIKDLGLSISDAAKAAKLQRTHLSAMLAGVRPVSIITAIKFEAAFGGPSPLTVRDMSDRYESAKVLKDRDAIIRDIVRVPSPIKSH